MGENHGGTQAQNAGVMSHLPPRYHLWTLHAETAEVTSRKHETGKRDALKGARPVWRVATRSRIHSRWAWKQDSTRCAAIGTLPRHATGVIVLCEALGTMKPHSSEWHST